MPAGVPRARTTWGSGRTATSRRARTSRSSRARFAARAWRTCGRPRQLFTDIRRRTSLGGRCGECEMNGHCGGCRARAYGMTGDLMAEDPLCTHTPGTFAASPLLLARRSPGEGGVVGRASVVGAQRPAALEYGPESPATVAWDDDADGTHEEGARVRAGDGDEGRRGVLPQERPRSRDRRRTRTDPRADADAEDVRLGIAYSIRSRLSESAAMSA